MVKYISKRMGYMKKEFVLRSLFVLSSLFCLSTDAQINRYFWGLELGSSTKESVKAFFSSNGLEYEEGYGGYDAIALTDLRDLGFGGYSWSPVFSFYNNILYSVNMTRSNVKIDLSIGEEYEIDIKAIFFDLKEKLSKKYKNYEEVSTDEPNSLYVVRDNKTVVVMQLMENRTLFLEYGDRRLAKMAESGNDL